MKSTRITPALVFTFVFLVYFYSPVNYITDSRWTLHTSWAIIHQHNTRLDAFKPVIEKNNYYGIDTCNGHLYYYFPPGTPLLCAPLFWAVEQAGKRIFYFDTFSLLESFRQTGMEVFLASLFTALSVILLWIVLRQWQVEKWLAWLLVFAFAFGTSAWSVSSRGLFAHGPSMFFLLGGLWALNKCNQKIDWLWLAGFFFAFAYVIRPTNSIPLALFTVYVLWQYRSSSWRFIASALPVLLLFFAFSYSIYGHTLTPYYHPSHIDEEHVQHHFWPGLLGTLVSPSRGLFIYSPFLLLLLPALYCAAKRKILSALHICLIVILILHTILISYFNKWYGGWCFGPRYFADVIPFLILLLAVGLQTILSSTTGARKWLFGLLVILTLVSCWINLQGATNSGTFKWNYLPNNIDDHRERLWDWQDMQFLR